jgi:hypothetical protein
MAVSFSARFAGWRRHPAWLAPYGTSPICSVGPECLCIADACT